ncbi:protein phosphatase [Moraxella osloensis]|uniref:Protein phosphatase n=1 Tax=Faucicola osloensis TaxID=34062 RepID=A0AAW6TKB4_FAUOS|nr:protein phosphatase [Moraxella osloensis]
MTRLKEGRFMPLLSAQLCAISFQGNASNGLQQDAFFLIDDYYQTPLGITEVKMCEKDFCVAVADGVAQTNLSQYASLSAVKAVKKFWHNYQLNQNQSTVMSMQSIYEHVANAPSKYRGAMTTLALVYRLKDSDEIVVKHVGDSRVYLQRHDETTKNGWRCITRDHNLLNQLVDDNAEAEGRKADVSEYNKQGMATALYTITDYLTIDNDEISNPMPSYDSQILQVKAGDCLVVCSDGVHDLVSCEEWSTIDEQTDLQDWLKNLRKQIYVSQGRAYDNVTVIVIRFC